MKTEGERLINSLTLPGCLGDSGVFMKYGFFKSVIFDDPVKHGFKILQFFLSFVRKGERGRWKWIPDKWKQSFTAKDRGAPGTSLKLTLFEVVHGVHKKQT